MRKRLDHFIHTFRGSSFPTQSVTEDGEHCVTKLRGAGNGSDALISEFVVNRLASRIGMAVPDVFVLDIACGHPWDFGTDEFYDLVMKSDGANLGIQLLSGVKLVEPVHYSSIPHEIVSQLVTLDLTFANFDRSSHSSNLVVDEDGKYWIIDHGSCRFLFLSSQAHMQNLHDGHIFLGMEDAFDSRWLAAMPFWLISQTVAEIPDEWLIDSGLARAGVRSRIADVLIRGRQRE